jgi:hypothetical protein
MVAVMSATPLHADKVLTASGDSFTFELIWGNNTGPTSREVGNLT